MIKTLNTDLNSNWTNYEVGTNNITRITPTMNADGTRNTGYYYTNILNEYPLNTSTRNKTIIFDINTTQAKFYIGLEQRVNESTIRNFLNFNHNTTNNPSNITSGNHTVIFTINSSGAITVYMGSDSYSIGNLYSGNDSTPIYLYFVNYNSGNVLTVNNVRVVDTVLSSTEIDTILGNGGGQ